MKRNASANGKKRNRKTTYRWLQRKAQESARTPDQVADDPLRQQLAPKHAYIEVVEKIAGRQAVIKGTRVPVSVIVGYLRLGRLQNRWWRISCLILAWPRSMMH